MGLASRICTVALAAGLVCGCRTGDLSGAGREPAADEEVAREQPPSPPPSSPDKPRPDFQQESPKSQSP